MGLTMSCPTCKGCGLLGPDGLPWFEFVAATPPVDGQTEFRPHRCGGCGGQGTVEQVPVEGDLRVWAIRNPPAHPTFYRASNLEVAKHVLEALVASDLNMPWVQANVFGLEIFQDGEWSEWENAEGQDICAVLDAGDEAA